MKTTFLLFVSAGTCVTLLQLVPCKAAPRKPINTYDQRQDGKLNVHAKLENFLIVVAPSSSTGNADLAGLLQNDLVAQALDLKNIASRVAGHPENVEISASSEDSTDPAAETSVLRINSQELAAEKPEKETGTNVKLIAIVQRETSLKNENDLKSNINTQTMGETLDASEPSRKTARSLTNISSELSVSKLPPRETDQQFPLENKVSGIGLNDRGNTVGPVEREPQELKLLGDAIENCGPDRFRDSIGVCQSRVDA